MIDPKIMARYTKLKATMEATEANANERANAARVVFKMEAEHPGLREAFAQEKRVKRHYEEVKAQKAPGVPRPSEVHPPPETGGSFVDRLRRVAIRGFGSDPLKMGAEAIEQQLLRTAEKMAAEGREYIETWKEGHIMAGSIADTLAEELDIEIEEAEEDHADGSVVAVYDIKLVIPVALWERLVAERGGADAFVQAISDALTEEAK